MKVQEKNNIYRQKHLEIIDEINKKCPVDYKSISFRNWYFIFERDYDYICRFRLKNPIFKNWVFEIWLNDDITEVNFLGENIYIINKFKPGHTSISEHNYKDFIKKLNQYVFVNNIIDRDFKDKILQDIKRNLIYMKYEEKIHEREIKIKKRIKLIQELKIKSIFRSYKKYFEIKLKYYNEVYPEHLEVKINLNKKSKTINSIKLLNFLIEIDFKLNDCFDHERDKIQNMFFNDKEVQTLIKDFCKDELSSGSWNLEDCRSFNMITEPVIVIGDNLKNKIKSSKFALHKLSKMEY